MGVDSIDDTIHLYTSLVLFVSIGDDEDDDVDRVYGFKVQRSESTIEKSTFQLGISSALFESIQIGIITAGTVFKKKKTVRCLHVCMYLCVC